ncbi:pyridoxal phosphate-dependent aminotransferase [candidate division KSB1 bacterium]|nr:pyridoxal phosphate-dependent aminotransferase [candidate division KSB1 bacterium]
MPLAKRVQNVTISLTLQITNRARELATAGIDVVDLSCGEPDHPTPLNIKQAGIAAIEQNFTRYTSAAGIPELRRAIQRKLADENGLQYDLNQIVVSSGAKHSIANAILAMIDPGDEVVIPRPCWLSYPEMVELAGGTTVFADTDAAGGFHLTPRSLERALSPKTKLVILNSPNNPTGAALDLSQIAALCEVLKRYSCFVLSDEIYERLRFDGKPHASPAQIAGMPDRTIVVNGVSKCYSMTGWRIGYAAGPPAIIDGILRVQSQMTSSCCSISQKAAAEGISGDQSGSAAMVRDFARRRDLCYEILSSCPGVKVSKPEGAFYFFPDISSYFGKHAHGDRLKDSLDIARYLLEEVHVATVPGSAFHAPTCLRLSYANSDENIKRGVSKVCEALTKLN